MRALLCLALLTPLLVAQTTFEDPAFGFHLEVPEGLVQVEEADLRAFLGLPDEVDLDGPADPERPDSLMHQFLWRDAQGMGREMKLVLAKDPRGLPFTDPADFVKVVTSEMGLTVDKQDQVNQPLPRFMVEGTRTRAADGAVMRMREAYLILGKGSFGILYVQGLEADWPALDAPFQAVFDTLRYPPPKMEGGQRGGAAGGGAMGPGQPAGLAASGTAAASASESWGSLEVTGSLVLAVLLLMSLAVGGKG